MKCLQCGSEDIAQNLRALDKSHGIGGDGDLKLEAFENPDALVFDGRHEFPLRANVCKQCGFVMFSILPSDIKVLKESKSGFSRTR